MVKGSEEDFIITACGSTVHTPCLNGHLCHILVEGDLEGVRFVEVISLFVLNERKSNEAIVIDQSSHWRIEEERSCSRIDSEVNGGVLYIVDISDTDCIGRALLRQIVRLEIIKPDLVGGRIVAYLDC